MLKATCPNWGSAPGTSRGGQAPAGVSPVSATICTETVSELSLSSNPIDHINANLKKTNQRVTESIYDVMSGGFLRVTNTRPSRGLGRVQNPFQQVHEGPLEDFKELESSAIAAEWLKQTAMRQSTRLIWKHFWRLQSGGTLGEPTTDAKMARSMMAARKGLRVVCDSATRNAEIQPILLAVAEDEFDPSTNQFIPDLEHPVVLTVANPDSWAILGAPGHRWFFELLFHNRETLGYKVPEMVKLFRTNDQIGMLWTLIDYDARKANSVRSRIRELYPNGIGPGGSAGGLAGPPGNKRPRPDGGDEGPSDKRPNTGRYPTGPGQGQYQGH